MNLNGEVRLPAGREAVWQALRDPATLRACIPGCDELVQVGETAYEGLLRAKVGTVATTFDIRAGIADAVFPAGYTLTAHAHSETGGYADGTATVTLTAEREGTLLGYRLRITPGGRLASVGERLLHGVAVASANAFFANLIERLRATAGAAAVPQDLSEPTARPRRVVLQPIAPAPPPLPAEAPRPAAPAPTAPPSKAWPVGGLLIWLAIVALLFWPRG